MSDSTATPVTTKISRRSVANRYGLGPGLGANLVGTGPLTDTRAAA